VSWFIRSFDFIWSTIDSTRSLIYLLKLPKNGVYNVVVGMVDVEGKTLVTRDGFCI